MRKKIIISILVLLSLTACVYDPYRPEYCTDEPVYLAFVLKGAGLPVPAETKATSSETSWSAREVAEQLVNQVDLYFYTGGGQYLGKHRQTSFTQQTWDSGDQNVSNKVGEFVVKLNYRPYRMLVTVNSEVDLKDKTLEEARAVLQGSEKYQSSVKVDKIKYKDGSSEKEVTDVYPFYMSSSTYLDGNRKEICDLLISNSYIKDKAADALAKPLPVYLERLAAKVDFIVPQKEFMVPIVTSQDTVTAKVTLIGWDINAVNANTYYFKKVNPAWDYSFKQGSSPSIYWNNTGMCRSYWSQDLNYVAGDHSGISTSQQTAALPEDKFVYRKPADLTRGWTDDAGRFVGTAYCFENTSDAGTLPVTDTDASSLYSRATHIIVKAQLSFDIVSGSEDDDDFASAKDFFRYKGMFYTKQGLLKALRRDTKDYGNPLDGIADDNLQMTSAQDLSYCKGYDKGERVAVQQISPAVFPDLKDASGNPVRIDGFRNGYFYYKIPIEHINNEDPSGSAYPLGKYAVVRNHNYQITIGDKLGGIGTGIWEEKYDIRPFRKMDDYRVTAYVKVSPWTQYETRFLFVDPSGLLVTDGQSVIKWADEGDPSKDGINDWTGNGWYF